MAAHFFAVCFLITLVLVPATICSIADVIESIANIDSYREKSYDKLISLKHADDGWGYDTPRVVTALQLVDNSWSGENFPSVKQMQVELLSELLNDDVENPMRAGRLATFVTGLVATCQNVINFHQTNLVEKLNSMRIYNSFELGYVSLALCVAGAEVDQNKIELMVSYLHNFTATETYLQDYIAVLLQAIECVVKTNPSTKLNNVINKAAKELKKSQNVGGNFGNVDTSAIVAQALLRANDNDWNASAIIYYFLDSQTADGTIGNNAATVQIYPTLYAKNYIDLLQIKCTTASHPSTTRIINTINETTIGDKTISIIYSLWIGNDANEKIHLQQSVSSGLSFYEIMKIATKQDSRYKFEATESSYGHYIRSINGIGENLTANMYWMLGVLKEHDEFPTRTHTGVDAFYPLNGDHVVFWYQTMTM